MLPVAVPLWPWVRLCSESSAVALSPYCWLLRETWHYRAPLRGSGFPTACSRSKSPLTSSVASPEMKHERHYQEFRLCFSVGFLVSWSAVRHPPLPAATWSCQGLEAEAAVWVRYRGHCRGCDPPDGPWLVLWRQTKAVPLNDLSACEISSPIPACLCLFCGSPAESKVTQNTQMERNNSNCMWF